MSEIESKVKKIIEEKLSVNADQITNEAKFAEDLKADSLDTVELVMARRSRENQDGTGRDRLYWVQDRVADYAPINLGTRPASPRWRSVAQFVCGNRREQPLSPAVDSTFANFGRGIRLCFQ
jgi:hypothetical protein